jgi:hypothetical protein
VGVEVSSVDLVGRRPELIDRARRYRDRSADAGEGEREIALGSPAAAGDDGELFGEIDLVCGIRLRRFATEPLDRAGTAQAVP